VGAAAAGEIVALAGAAVVDPAVTDAGEEAAATEFATEPAAEEAEEATALVAPVAATALPAALRSILDPGSDTTTGLAVLSASAATTVNVHPISSGLSRANEHKRVRKKDRSFNRDLTTQVNSLSLSDVTRDGGVDVLVGREDGR
jgi:type IV secretory pathway VirJ component